MKDLVEEGIDGVLTVAQRLLAGVELSSGWELIVV